MTNPVEEVLGEIPVTSKLRWGFERLSLLVTSNRIVVARVGKRGTGALATSSILGKFADAFEDLLKSGRESRGKKSVERSGPEEILAANKDNFALHYAEVVKVELQETEGPSILVLFTTKDKLEFSTMLQIDKLVELLEPQFEGRVTARRLSTGKRPSR